MLPLNTVTVGAAVAPEVVGTWFSHVSLDRVMHLLAGPVAASEWA